MTRTRSAPGNPSSTWPLFRRERSRYVTQDNGASQMSDKNNEDLKRQASENTLGLNPVIGIRGKDLLTSARMVLSQALKQPFHSAKHVAHFGLELKLSLIHI